MIGLRRLTWLVVIAVGLAGCIDYTERVDISRDGSATIRLRLRISTALQTLVLQNPAFRPLAILMDRDTLERNLPAGLTLRSHTHSATPGRQIFISELAASDARQIQSATAGLFSGQSFSVETLPDGSLRYRRTLDFTGAMQDPEFAKMVAENRMGILGILKGAPFKFQLAAPFDVKSSNGVLDQGAVTWEYSLYELLQKPVEQEVVLAAPTAFDVALGMAQRFFQPRFAPAVAVILLILFFVVAPRARPA